MRIRGSRFFARSFGGYRKLPVPLLSGWRRPRDSSWFDHPEMQARIARAEADLREGRFVDVHSEGEIYAYFDALGEAPR